MKTINFSELDIKIENTIELYYKPYLYIFKFKIYYKFMSQ